MRLQKLNFFFVLLSAFQLHAQQLLPESFARLTTTQGLTHNNVTGITQDATGYVWVSTPLGLNRFDGSRFVQYHSNSDARSLASEDLTGLAWINKNELGVYNTGLHIINTKKGVQRNIFIPYYKKQYQYKFNMVEKAIGDDDGNIYVLSRSGFYHFDKRDSLVSRFDYYNEPQVPVEHFFFGKELFQLDKNRLLIVSINGLYVYEKVARKVKKMEANEYPLFAEFINYPAVYCWFLQNKPGCFIVLKSLTDTLVYIDYAARKKTVSRLPFRQIKDELHWRSFLLPVNDTEFYVTGHNTGFFKGVLNKSTGTIILSPKYFGNYLCTALMLDKANNLWVGTNKGLWYQQNRPAIERADLPGGLEENYPNIIMNNVFVDESKVYVGTRSRGHLLEYNKKDLWFQGRIKFENEQKRLAAGQNFAVYAIAKLDSLNLLLATDGLPMVVNKLTHTASPLRLPNWSEENWATDVFTDSKNITWISASHVYQYNHRQKKSGHLPKEVQRKSGIQLPEVIREDADGNIWMAGHGLSRYNIKTRAFDRRVDSFPFIKMPDKQVNVMAIDKKTNILWVNSHNNGLIGYDIATEKFRHFTTDHGLPDNNISALQIVGNKLWLAAAAGIACLDLNSYAIRSFGKEDGFPDMPVMSHANFFYDSAAGQLYIPFAKQIVRFNPFEIIRNGTPPTVFIESMVINNRPPIFHPEPDQKIAWNETELQLTIGAIDFQSPGSLRYDYRIIKEGESPWISLGSQPSFSVSSISPGTYRIEVKVSSATNDWPAQVKALNLLVAPPFWLRPWFLCMIAVLVLVLIYALVQWRTRLARRKEMINTQIEKLKANEYKAQFELAQISQYFSSSLAGKKTEDEVLWDVAKNLIGHMNYEDCIIYSWNKEKTAMVQKAAFGPKGAPEIISADAFMVSSGQGIVGHVMQTKKPLLVNDTRKDSRYRVDDDFRLSEVAVPILHNGELLGVIDSENSKPHYYSERDIQILSTIATLIGNKLDQLQSEQMLEAKQQELAGINEQLVEARLSALQAQMNPHFIFNALNSIKRMILDGDNEKASRYLSKFALMIRMTLEHSKEVFVTLDENIQYLKAYLDMEKLRFEDSFTYSIYADDEVDTAETVLPSMMIQPIVENAIWHGLMQSATEKKLRIAFTQVENRLACTVEDNGIGIHRSEKLKETQRPLHRSIGLENLQKRIRIMNEKYKTDCSLEITDLKIAGINGSGTRVVLQMNMINI